MVRLGMLLALVAAAALSVSVRAQTRTIDPLYAGYDETLDLYVRDGFVYYNTLRSARGRLDRFIADLATASLTSRQAPAAQTAFWINAYNALVLRTVIDNFPIRGKSPDYPSDSIRQIPGAFEKRAHRVAGRTMTLDQIEKDILTPLGDARLFLALGRGSVGGGRLRSEAYDAAKLEEQLESLAAETVTRRELARVDTVSGQLSVSPLFSWREAAFVASYADKAPAVFAERSPLERAVLGLIEPHLVGGEADYLERNLFRMVFHEYDWRLNDLNTRSPN